jgi:hypothetical protein
LDEYLVDLEFSQETRDHIVNNDTTNMNFNFTQAAMVLQNSSGIYSRKVDYLHTYVYKIQDELLSTINNQHGTLKGTTGNNNKKNSIGIDQEIEEFLNFDPHQEFLPLNDVIPTCDVNEYKNKINLQFTDTDHMNLDSTVLSPSTRRRSSILDSVSRRRFSHRMSMGSTSLFLDQTMMTESGNNSNMLHVAARNALLGTLDTTGTLRLQSGVCDIGEDGILRIPGSSSQERIVENNQFSNNTTSSHDDTDNDFEARMDDDNDDHGGFMMANDDNDNENLVQNAVLNPQEKSKRVTFSDTSLPPAPLKPKENLKNDPWALLDRDATNVRKPRPLRIGKTIVLPETVDKPPSECVTGARTRHTARVKTERVPRLKLLQSLSSSIDTSDKAIGLAIGKKRTLEKNQLHLNKSGLAFGDEFAYIAKDVAKYHAEKRRELRLRSNKEQQSRNAMNKPTLETNDDQNEFVGTFGGQFNDEDDDDFDYPEDNGVDVLSDDAPMESNTGIKSLSDVYQNRDKESGTLKDPHLML